MTNEEHVVKAPTCTEKVLAIMYVKLWTYNIKTTDTCDRSYPHRSTESERCNLQRRRGTPETLTVKIVVKSWKQEP